jgi:SAM-dependent MidA family methyltransferase
VSDLERGGATELLDRIRAAIRADGPLCFARYMDLALYEPGLGYYAAGAGRIGREGDFFTASDVGTLFGECLLGQMAEMDGLLGSPDPFGYVEFGPGSGRLARDVLDTARRLHPAFAARIAACMVERSPAMRDAARRLVPEASVVADPGPAMDGCVVAVELFDALPVHRLRRRDGALVEVRVAADAGGALHAVETEPCPEAAAIAARYGAAALDGYEAEVCTAAAAVLDRMAAALRRGFVVIVDYGHPAEALYSAARRRGTLLAYHRHTTSEDVLERVGEQDLTAHANFTQLADLGRERGLEVLGLTSQERFLIGNGILRHFADDGSPEWGRPERVRRRLQAKQLIHPAGMGGTFRVLILAKGLEPGVALAGLAGPEAWAQRWGGPSTVAP